MTEQTLTIRWGGETYSASPGMEVSVGRDRDCTIVLTSEAVSRRHGAFVHEASTWVYRDLQSTQGSFVRGSAVDRLPITAATTITLGQGPDAVTVTAEPVGRTLSDVAAAPAEGVTRAVSGRAVGGARPGGELGSTGAAPTVIPAGSTDEDVTASTTGETRSARPGQTITIGREADNDLVLDDAAVSRHHARIEHAGSGWELVDLGSSAGTWLDGQRVTRAPLAGDQKFLLGDRAGDAAVETRTRTEAAAPPSPPPPTPPAVLPPPPPPPTGPAVSSSGAPTSARAGRSIVAAIVAVAVALVAVGAGAYWWTHRAPSRDTLAQATVQVRSPQGWSGSGTVIDKARGLILTNAHVADPKAIGTGVRQQQYPEDDSRTALTPQPFVIWVSAGTDRAAEPRFTATPVASDGYLDLAILRIDKTIAGAQVEPADLEFLTEITLGDSSTVTSGDKVTLVGYPGAANSLAPTFTEGVISGVRGDDRQKINNALLNVDAAINAGNSGGLAVDGSGRMIGVPSLSWLEPGDLPGTRLPTGLGALVPIASARALIDAVVGGGTYTSPWTVALGPGATVSSVALAAPKDVPGAVGEGCQPASGGGSGLAFAIRYSGLPVGEHTDVMVQLRDADGKVQAAAVSQYPTSLPAAGCATATMAYPAGVQTVPDGRYQLIIGAGGNYQVLKTITFTKGVATETPGASPGPGGSPGPGDPSGGTNPTAPPTT